jgi:hypothetical protein
MKNLTLEKMEENLRKWLDEMDSSRLSYDLFIKKSGNASYLHSEELYETSIVVYLYTNTNRYYIVASETKDGLGYLECKSSSRKSRTGEEKCDRGGSDLHDGGFSKETWTKIIKDIIAYESVRVQKYNFEDFVTYRASLPNFLELDLNPIFHEISQKSFYSDESDSDSTEENKNININSILQILWLDLRYVLSYIISKRIEPFYGSIPSDVRFKILTFNMDYDFIHDKNPYKRMKLGDNNYDICLDFIFDKVFVNLPRNKENVKVFKEWLSNLKPTVKYSGIEIEVYKRYLEKYDKKVYEDFYKNQGGEKRKEWGRKLLAEGAISEATFWNEFSSY